MSRIFSDWLKTFRNSINSYSYYIDFKKVYRQAENIKLEINLLNSLVGSREIEEDFENLLRKYPECLKAIPFLLAVRQNKIFCQDEKGATSFRFDQETQSIQQYKYFMKKTGLFDLLQNHIISSLYDYVTGVEVGLDSNGRKNRGGHQMEDLVESYIKKTGHEYYKEMELKAIEEKWKISLSSISADGTTTKRFDFVVKTPEKTFGIETNFYASAGSKLNETARSYKMIAQESKNIEGFSFVWVTDGAGWFKARHNLEETFNVLENLYNIKDMEDGAFKKLFS